MEKNRSKQIWRVAQFAFLLMVCFAGRICAQVQGLVKGSVTDGNGEPLIGVNVVVKGTANGVVSDFSGGFSIAASPDDVLSFSYVGYVSQEVRVGNNKFFEIVLQEDTRHLEEVVVVGYGTQKKVNLTGAVSSVTADDLVNKPVTSTAQAIAGLVPGLSVITNSGRPGASASVKIRGTGTFSSAGTDPLVTAITNVGVDFGLFNGAVNGSVEYFYKYTSDILAPVEVTGIMGRGVGESNVGAVSNKGIEVNLSFNGHIGKDFRFSIAPNFTWVKNAVEELANGATEEINNNRIVGQPIGIIYGYLTDGLFVDQAEIDAAPEQLVSKEDLKPGYVKYKDISGPDGVPDGKVDAEYDRTVLGSTTPKFYYGLNLSASYKGFDFSALLQGLGGYQRLIGSYMAYAFYNNGNIQRWQAENCWTEENPDKWAEYPRIETLNMNNTNLQTSDYWVRNASFLRIKTVQLGYTFPRAWTKKFGVEKLRLYVSGQNLYSFNAFYKGWDPENEISTGDAPSYYPITAIYSFGVNLNF